MSSFSNSVLTPNSSLIGTTWVQITAGTYILRIHAARDTPLVQLAAPRRLLALLAVVANTLADVATAGCADHVMPDTDVA